MPDPATVPEVSVDELAAHLGSGGLLLDVRNPDEWVAQRVPGVPLIPLAELPERIDDVPRPGPGGRLLVICRSGARSARAVAFLRDHGVDAVNVAGGTVAWADAGHPVDAGPG
jgi:rhodanese-related sulfurtransferase